MKFIEIHLTKCTVFLTEAELQKLLQSNPSLYKESLVRGKYINRYRKQKLREEKKLYKEG